MKALLKKTKFCDSEIFPVSAASSLGIQDVLNEIPKHIEVYVHNFTRNQLFILMNLSFFLLTIAFR